MAQYRTYEQFLDRIWAASSEDEEAMSRMQEENAWRSEVLHLEHKVDQLEEELRPLKKLLRFLQGIGFSLLACAVIGFIAVSGWASINHVREGGFIWLIFLVSVGFVVGFALAED